RGAARPGRPVGRLLQRGGEETDPVPQELLEEDRLAGEVVVDRALRHPRPLGDLVHGGGGETLFGDEGDGRLVEPLPGGLTAGAAARRGAAASHGPDCHSPAGPPGHRLSSGCSRSSVHTWRRRADRAGSASAPAVKTASTAHACHTGPSPPPVMSRRSASTTSLLGRYGCSASETPG